MIDTLAALLAPAWMGSSPFFVLAFYWSFRRMPSALIDAARLDGLSAFGIWARIAMPMARPTIVAVGVLTFVQYWSDFINPLLYLSSDARYTLSVGLRVLQQMDASHEPAAPGGGGRHGPARTAALPRWPSVPFGCQIELPGSTADDPAERPDPRLAGMALALMIRRRSACWWPEALTMGHMHGR